MEVTGWDAVCDQGTGTRWSAVAITLCVVSPGYNLLSKSAQCHHQIPHHSSFMEEKLLVLALSNAFYSKPPSQTCRYPHTPQPLSPAPPMRRGSHRLPSAPPRRACAAPARSGNPPERPPGPAPWRRFRGRGCAGRWGPGPGGRLGGQGQERGAPCGRAGQGRGCSGCSSRAASPRARCRLSEGCPRSQAQVSPGTRRWKRRRRPPRPARGAAGGALLLRCP